MDVLVCSPECTHHSNARGGKPMSDQSRCGAFLILQWASQIYIERILLENVVEFEDWGPLGANKRPIAKRKGELFRTFVQGLERIGYVVEWRILDAADYGAATSRTRFILQAVRRGKIVWPAPTHAKAGAAVGLKPWRDWQEIIDWDFRGSSIFTRKKPLSEKTLGRIYAGLLEQGLAPFLIEITHSGKRKARGPGRPLPTITTANRGELALCRPSLLPQQSGGKMRLGGQPRPTIAAAGAIGLVRPFLVEYYGTSRSAVSAGKPLGVVTTKARFGLARPVVEMQGRRMVLDVEYRMLQPHELAAGMGFPPAYKITGNKTEQIKQIGNAVECHIAEALGGAVLDGMMAA